MEAEQEFLSSDIHLHVLLPFLSKGNKFCYFLFAFMCIENLQYGLNSKTKEFAPKGANSFFLELNSIDKGGKN